MAYIQEGYRLMVAATFGRRLRGLLFGDYGDAVLLIGPCKAIHTFGMAYPIDVAFIDHRGNVISSELNVEERSMIRNRNAAAVLERKASNARWFEAGEQVFVTKEGLR